MQLTVLKQNASTKLIIPNLLYTILRMWLTEMLLQ